MARESKFKITRFVNPSGKKVFRVTGTLDGVQIRRNFKTHKEAKEERDDLEIKRLAGPVEGRKIWSKITPEEHNDAWAALRLLKGAKIESSLTDAIQYYVRHYKPPKANVTLKSAVEEYIQQREDDLAADTLSHPQFKAIRTNARFLAKKFEDWNAADVQADDIEKLLLKDDISAKTWNNRRSYYHTFFAFCETKQYVSSNPVAKVKMHKIKRSRGTADTLTPEKAAELMAELEEYRGHEFKDGRPVGEKGCLVPYFALTLFAGIRPDWKNGEISKLRPEDINFATGVIHIEPEVSKNDEKRTIKIQPNLKKWLRAYPLEKYPILPYRNFEPSLREIRKKHSLTHDVLRHTFISMHVGKFRSVGDAALEAGNSDAIIRKHYLDVIAKEEAERFWEIEPKHIVFPSAAKKEKPRIVQVETRSVLP